MAEPWNLTISHRTICVVENALSNYLRTSERGYESSLEFDRKMNRDPIMSHTNYLARLTEVRDAASDMKLDWVVETANNHIKAVEAAISAMS